jgi:hypothetical protein
MVLDGLDGGFTYYVQFFTICEELTTALQLSSKFYVTRRLRAGDKAQGDDKEDDKDEDLSHEGNR